MSVSLLVRRSLGRSSAWLAVLGLCVSVSACSSWAPPAKEPIGLRLQVKAADDVNPDEQGRAAPIMVRIYELKSATAFEQADFFSLQNASKKTLGEDVLATDEYILRPGEKQDMTRKSNPATTAIGVLAGYRDLGKSVWRAVYKLPPAPDAAWYRAVLPEHKARLKIDLGRQAAAIQSEDN